MAQPQKQPLAPPIGLCLSGGGALGFVHLGAIQALEEAGIHPDYISGSSMGALIGCMYANGYSPNEIMHVVEKHKLNKKRKLISARKSKRGIAGMWDIVSLLGKELIPHNHFDSLSTPFYACVTNLSTGKATYVGHGSNLAQWVCASASVPGIFESMEIDNQYYTDGGVTDNLPITPLKETCNSIIAIDALSYPTQPQVKNTADVLLLSMLIMNSYTAQNQIDQCNWYIPCKGAEQYNALDFAAYQALFEIGYNNTKAYIDGL